MCELSLIGGNLIWFTVDVFKRNDRKYRRIRKFAYSFCKYQSSSSKDQNVVLMCLNKLSRYNLTDKNIQNNFLSEI